MALNSQFYIERLPLESRCYEAISHPAALLDIKAPWQMGKTSLVLRIMNQARQLGYRVLVVNLHQAHSTLFSHLDKFLTWFCTTIARKLEQGGASREQLAGSSSKDNCTAFMENFVLAAADAPVLLVLENLDAIFPYPEMADDFLRLLRFWQEQSTYGDKNSILWEKLRLVLVRGTGLLDVPLNFYQYPLLMGLTIELQPFTPEQVDELARRHELHLSSQQLEQFHQLVAGHPYLVRLALYHIIGDNISIEEAIATASSNASIYRHHLHQLLGYLQQHPVLAAAFADVLHSPTPIKLELKLASQLHTLGLVDIKDNGVTASCELYRQYFQDMF